jgi:hypothetical protein
MRQLVATTKELGEIIGEMDLEGETLEKELTAGLTPTLRQKFIPNLVDGLIAIGRKRRSLGRIRRTVCSAVRHGRLRPDSPSSMTP